MIHTRFGSEVEVIGGDYDNGRVIVRRRDDGYQFECRIIDLRADNGLREIEEAWMISLPMQRKNATG